MIVKMQKQRLRNKNTYRSSCVDGSDIDDEDTDSETFRL